MRVPNALLSLALISALMPPVASGSDVYTVDFNKQELYRIDLSTGGLTNLGSLAVSTGGETGFGGLVFGVTGELFALSNGFPGGKLYTVDTTTGTTTLYHDLPGPVAVGGFDRDPTSGDLYWLATGFLSQDLIRYDLGTGQVANLGSFGFGLLFSGMAFDPNGNLYGLNASTNALWRLDESVPGSPLTAPIGAGLGAGISIQNGSTLTRDATTGDLVGYASNSKDVFLVDPATGLGTVLFTLGATDPDFFGFAGAPCRGAATTYGSGCAGSGGFVPVFEPTTCPDVGGTLLVEIRDGLGGSSALILFGLAQGAAPIGGGCQLLVTPVLPPVGIVPLFGAGAGGGKLEFGGALPASIAGFTFTMQAFVIDPGAILGYAASNGIELMPQ